MTSYTFTKDGTPFITSLCRTLATHSHNKEFGELYRTFLLDFNRGNPTTLPEMRNLSFAKKFFFNPWAPSFHIFWAITVFIHMCHTGRFLAHILKLCTNTFASIKYTRRLHKLFCSTLTNDMKYFPIKTYILHTLNFQGQHEWSFCYADLLCFISIMLKIFA